MAIYDFVMAGGGLAGLSLACHLAQSPLGAGSMLIIDSQPGRLKDRTWSYWTDQPTIFDPVVHHRWSRLKVACPPRTSLISLTGSRYELVRGRDLRRFAQQTLLAQRNVSFQTGRVEQILDGRQGARVVVDGRMIEAQCVFDSTSESEQERRACAGRRRLSMQFRAWTIETAAAAFSPQVATFLDFRTPQKQDARFFYVLPISERKAMVQYVAISTACLDRLTAETALREYLAATLGLGECSIGAEQAGSLALSAAIPPRRLGRHVMAIGAKGGLVKPSTGFGFQRIERNSAAIVRSLVRTGLPWSVPAVSERHRLYDSLLLDVLARHGHEAQAIFYELFAHNPIGRVLRFLDETSTPAEELELIATLPARPFLEALPRRMMARAGW